MPPAAVAMTQLLATVWSKWRAFPEASPGDVRELMLIVNWLPLFKELRSSVPLAFSRLQPGSAPAPDGAVASLMYQTLVPPPLKVMLPVSVRVPIASRALTVPLMVVLPMTVPTQFRVWATPIVKPPALRRLPSRVAPAATVITGLLGIWPAPASANVPWLTVVLPR